MAALGSRQFISLDLFLDFRKKKRTEQAREGDAAVSALKAARHLTILNGDALETLKALPSESAQCCVTSPPYWGLRDYGIEGQIGLEKTPEEYVSKLVEVFREVRRVLKNDGTLWLNLGDSYAGSGKGRGAQGASCSSNFQAIQKANKGSSFGKIPSGIVPKGLKPKDLVGIPWRVAFALRTDGWWLRSEIIWHKPNPMPESVRDRPTKAHEFVFLLTKSAEYFYDADAVKEAANFDGRKDTLMKGSPKYVKGCMPNQLAQTAAVRGHERWPSRMADGTHARNRRSVWTIATQPYKGSHFATFPEKLPKTCILAGTQCGDTVLDPFSGSGTTGKVALELGRKSILIELNPAYVELINKRCKTI